MAVVPTGSPAWSRTAEIESYGGNVNKRNYLGGGVVDATTDVGAEDFSRMVADVAAVVRTASFGVMTLQLNDSAPAAPTFLSVRLMTGIRLVSYEGNAAPSGFPVAEREGNGDVTIAFNSSYADEYGVSATFAITEAEGTAQGSAFCEVSVEIVSATTIRVRCKDAAGAAVSNPRITVIVG